VSALTGMQRGISATIDAQSAKPYEQMNTNKITTTDFSNPETKAIYEQDWDGDMSLKQRYENGQQCGACSFYAPFNEDYGLCCNKASRHLTETVFEHFACSAYVDEGWGPHSFSNIEDFKCRCHGEPIYRTMDTIITLLDRGGLDDELKSHLRILRRYIEEQRKA
jgi:hypothetical protein